jgi:hypothetical protein
VQAEPPQFAYVKGKSPQGVSSHRIPASVQPTVGKQADDGDLRIHVGERVDTIGRFLSHRAFVSAAEGLVLSMPFGTRGVVGAGNYWVALRSGRLDIQQD